MRQLHFFIFSSCLIKDSQNQHVFLVSLLALWVQLKVRLHLPLFHVIVNLLRFVDVEVVLQLHLRQ